MQYFSSYIIGTFVALFPIANPFGAVPIFYSLTAADTPAYRLQQAQQVAINVTGVLAVSLLAGRGILSFFGISLGVLRIAGGLLVAHTAWQMVTVQQRITPSENSAAGEKIDISFTPMAIPIISGPGAIGVIIGISTKIDGWSGYLGCLIGIGGFGLLLYLCLALGEKLLKVLGKNELGALNRVLGFFILAIAIQFISDGVFSLIQQSAPALLR